MTSDGPKIENLITLAEAAAASGNYQEAFAYFNSVLELDPKNYDAWFGKAAAAGWMSTLAKFRFAELFSGMQRAIELAPESQKSALRAKAALTTNEIADACYSLAAKHKNEYIRVPSTWPEYLGRCGLVIQAYEFAHTLNPNDVIAATNILSVCRDNIKPVRYVGFDRQRRTLSITPQYKTHLESLFDTYVKKIAEIDPGRQPQPLVENAGGCFVATATMGNPEHPAVITLQLFRDEVLAGSRWGGRLIDLYSVWGPVAAAAIRRSRCRRIAARLVIVWPLVLVAETVRLGNRRR